MKIRDVGFPVIQYEDKKWREGERKNNGMMKVKLVCVCKLVYITELSNDSGTGGIMHHRKRT